jgi:branched-chain amino acid transport system substrate-binding protein
MQSRDALPKGDKGVRSRRFAGILAAVALVTVASVSMSAAAGASSAGGVGSGKATPTHSICGQGTGKKATGAPIKIDGLDMLIPGVDFTTVGKVAKAYFDCVNDNGGIHGRPIKYTLYTEALDPNQEKALAKKMIESDKAVGVVGNTSFAECGTNAAYYQSKGYVVIGAGVQAECYSTPSFAETNMGPRYSNVGAAQALIAAGVKKISIASPDTISAYADGGVVQLGKQKGVQVKVFPTHLPVTDATSQLLQMYQFAGDGGGIILDFTPDTAPAFLKAGIQQNLVDKLKWGSSTPIANTLMASQFPQYDGHLWINSEFALVSPKAGPDSALMFQILKKYAPSIAPQSFGQMGFMDAKFATQALLSITGPVTAKSYNDAVRALKDEKTDMLCKPWYVGNLAYHIPNNTDITVDYKGPNVVLRTGCTEITAVDKAISQTRVWEKQYGLNT